MRDEHYWPAWDSDPVGQTGERAAVDSGDRADGRDTYGYADDYDYDPDESLRAEQERAYEGELAGELLEGEEPPAVPPTPGRRFRLGLGKAFMIAGGVMALLVVIYAADLILSAGDVPRGVTVAGVDVGGMSKSDAEVKLREELEPRLTQPIPVHAGDVDAQLDPGDSGLGLDWPSTVEQAGTQPLSPITRITSFFTNREVGVETKAEPDQLKQAVAKLAGNQLNHQPTEGSIRFQQILDSDGGVTAHAVEPRQGQNLADLDGAVAAVKDNWLDREQIEFGMAVTPVKATSAGVHAALDGIVAPAVAKPIVVKGEGEDAVLKPNDIGGSFQFAARDDGGLDVKLDQAKLQDAGQPQLAGTEQESKDAQIIFAGDRPSVIPSEQERKVSWGKTLQPFLDVIKKPEGREIKAVYDTKDPSITTEAANGLGIKEVIGEFTTNGFSGGAATNVAAIAGEVQGAIVKPGETFSLNGRTGPRAASGGYVSAPVHEDGTGDPVLGGGVSQFTSTLYNAAYFAGLADAGHTAHTHYMERYPLARDAKSLQDNGSNVDMAFRNDTGNGVAIQAVTSGSSVTVRIWGTKKYRVESATGPRTNIVAPPVEQAPPGCRPQSGSPGFTVTDTRIRYDIATGAEAGRDASTATYQPKAAVSCSAPPPPTPTPQPEQPPADPPFPLPGPAA